MNMISFLTRNRIQLLLTFCFVSFPQFVHGQKMDQKAIKGILYSDKAPVEISISDGKISEIEKAKEEKCPFVAHPVILSKSILKPLAGAQIWSPSRARVIPT